MAKVTTKHDLISLRNENFKKLFDLIDEMGEDAENSVFDFSENIGKEAHWKRDKNICDVLIHLYEWHNLLLEWENTNSNGVEKSFTSPPYNWKTYGDMNVEFWQKHQTTTLKKAKEILRESHNKSMAIIEKYTDEEMFTKKHFKWTGTSCLEQYFIGATARHYEWATKKIKAHVKSVQSKEN